MTKVNVEGVIQETIVGDRRGRDVVADVAAAMSEVLVGQRVGRKIVADVEAQTSDVLIGDRVGRNIAASVEAVTVEVLVRVAPIYVQHMHVDALVSLPNDPTRPGSQYWHLGQDALQQRDPLPHPSIVWSWTHYMTYRQVVTTHRTPRSWPFSQVDYRTLQRQVLLARPGPLPISRMDVRTLRRLTVQSRGDMYVPSSGVQVGGMRVLAPMARPGLLPPAEHRGSIAAAKVLALALVSKQARGPEPTDVQVAQHHQLAVAWRQRAWTVEQAVAWMGYLGVQARVTAVPHGPVDVAQQHMLAAQRRPDDVPHGPNDVAQQHQLAVQRRPDGVPMSDHGVGQFAQLASARRVTVRPDLMGAWGTAQLSQLAVSIRNVLLPSQVTHIEVGMARVTYAMRRTTKPPGEVVDPAVGRHVKTVQRLAVVYRKTFDPNEMMRRLRTVHTLAQIPLAMDRSFPPPPTEPEMSEGAVSLVAEHIVLSENEWNWEPTSAVTLPLVAQALATADTDGWADPGVAAGEAAVVLLAQAAIAADAEDWIDPLTAGSDANVVLVAQHLATPDSGFQPTTVPLSTADVSLAIEMAAVSDDSFPPGGLALATVDVLLVARSVASRDNTLVGNLPGSVVEASAVAQQTVVNDPGLVGIPLRPRGPRPRATITRH